MDIKNKKILLQLARESIRLGLEEKKYQTDNKKIPEILQQKAGTFVTLTINGELRGCIGHIEPVQEIYKDVIENAVSAAFYDPRFSPLSKDEFDNIKIEISVLSPIKKLDYPSIESLVEYLKKHKPGVIIQKNEKSATFLPQVWEDLPKVDEFLSQLCLKAGLEADEWTRGVGIETYTVEKI